VSINIPSHFVQQFSSNIALLLQQRGSKLRDAVTVGRHVGKQASPVDQIASITASKVTSRFSPMGRVDAAVDRRWVFPVDYDLPQLLDSFDKLRLITDPQSAYVQNAIYAMGRAMDDEILAAFYADAKTGENGGTTTVANTTASTSGGQQVVAAFGAASATGLTVAKLREARRVLMANEVDVDNDPMYCIVTSKQLDNLLAEAQVTSRDFNDRLVLTDGKIASFLGINFIQCERVPTNGSSQHRCPVYVKSGMYMGMWDDIKTSISQRNDLQGEPWQVYATGTFGATRIEEKRIVEIVCA